VHVVVDSTGLKIFGEGEWKVRRHGAGKRRPGRKVHLSVDETTKDIIGIEVTTTAWGDSEILPDLLDQVEGEIAQVSADGAYDSHGCHEAIAGRNARATLPPRDGAVRWGDDHPTTRATPFCGRSRPKDSMAGRTRVVASDAASRKTCCTGSSNSVTACPPDPSNDR
jgi:IS5 family transposase